MNEKRTNYERYKQKHFINRGCNMKTIQYTLVKIPIKEIISQDYNVVIDRDTEIKNEYLITQGTSLLFDQIERLRGKFTSHISEIILIVAKKNPKQEEYLRHILK